MTQEEKQLLLQDLCSRLPHGVILDYSFIADDGKRIHTQRPLTYRNIGTVALDEWHTNEEIFKPYLRPMSSMTRAEVLEYISLKESIVASDGITYFFETYKSIDWLNKKMFDYRKDDEDKTMIEKGLAIEAPEGMY